MYHLYAERANQANKNLYAVSKQCYVKFANWNRSLAFGFTYFLHERYIYPACTIYMSCVYGIYILRVRYICPARTIYISFPDMLSAVF